MKTFAALCVLALVAATQAATLTAEQTAKLREHYQVCIGDSHVDKELVKKARSGDFAEDKTLDDFFTCMFKRVGFLDNEGHLKKDVIQAKAPKDVSGENLQKVLDACAEVEKESKDKIAKEAYKCYLTKTPVKIQLIADAA